MRWQWLAMTSQPSKPPCCSRPAASARALQQMRFRAVRGPMSIGETRVGKAVAMAYPSAVFRASNWLWRQVSNLPNRPGKLETCRHSPLQPLKQVVVQQIADELFG